jgi:Mg-chelatase subunit ChlD
LFQARVGPPRSDAYCNTGVDFDHRAALVQPLTEDLAAVKAALDRIDSSGGTNIGEGLRVALDELDRSGTPVAVGSSCC